MNAPLRTLPRSNFPHHVEAAYKRILLARVDAFHQLVAGEVLDVLRQRTGVDERARRDSESDDEELLEQVIRLASDKAKDANPIPTDGLTELAARVDRHTTRQLDRQLLSAGVEEIEYSEVQVELFDDFVEANTTLIKSLDARYLADVKEVVREGVQGGETIDTIATKLEERASVSSSRAKTIARDQVATAGRKMTQARHAELGIIEYVWNTAGDERVRPSCKANDGKTFTWAQGDGGEHPGDRIMCRCTTEPVLDTHIEAPRVMRAARFKAVSDARIDEIMQGFMEPLPIDEHWSREAFVPGPEDFAEQLARGKGRALYGSTLLGLDNDDEILVDTSFMARPDFEQYIRANFGDDPRDIMGVSDQLDIILPHDSPSPMFTVVHEISHAIDHVLHGDISSPEDYDDVVAAFRSLMIHDPVQAAARRDEFGRHALARLIESEERAFRTQNEYRLDLGLEPVVRSAPELRYAIRDVYLDLFRKYIMRDIYGSST